MIMGREIWLAKHYTELHEYPAMLAAEAYPAEGQRYLRSLTQRI